MNINILLENILKALLDEVSKQKKKSAAKKRASKKGAKKSSRKKKRPGNKNYYKGTKKSNKQMEYEIGICSKPNPPARCYDEWSADKTYKKSKKGK